MNISPTGGVIAAASKKDALPLLQIGSISILKRIVLSFQQAGIFPIVIVTGTQEEEVKHQLSGCGVVFLHNDDCEEPELFASAKIGFSYLEDKCRRIVFTPVNVPMFTSGTLRTLMDQEGDVLIPCYEGVSGHPILISQSILLNILSYEGAGGLRAAVGACSCRLRLVSTNDPGVTISIHNGRQLGERVSEHNRTLLHPTMQLGLQRETVFFNSRMKLLLYLISYTHSVRSACGYMALSYGKAWDMLNKLEAEMGFPLVERRHGGSRGGNTTLTPRGLSFLEAWIQFENDMFSSVQARFAERFSEFFSRRI